MKKKILGLFVLAAIVTSTSVNATIDTGKDKEIVKSAEDDKLSNEASIKFLGEATSSNIVFDVNYANPTGNAFKIIITNTQGDQLFEQTFKGKDFNKKVMIKKDPDANGYVNFTVKPVNTKASYSKSFYLNTQSQYVSNTVVEDAK